MLVLNYLKSCLRPHGRILRLPAPGLPEARQIVLIHGLLHRGAMMMDFGVWLQRQRRCPVVVYDYATSRAPIRTHGLRLAEFLSAELRHCDGVDLVTHSMGGLLTRVALAELEKRQQADRIGRIVMLAPPHHGSDVARNVLRYFPPSRWMVRTLPDLSSAPGAAVHSLPTPHGYELGIIAAAFDEKVKLHSTVLPEFTDHITVPSRHSMMMNNPDARRCTAYFLAHGVFPAAETREIH